MPGFLRAEPVDHLRHRGRLRRAPGPVAVPRRVGRVVTQRELRPAPLIEIVAGCLKAVPSVDGGCARGVRRSLGVADPDVTPDLVPAEPAQDLDANHRRTAGGRQPIVRVRQDGRFPRQVPGHRLERLDRGGHHAGVLVVETGADGVENRRDVALRGFLGFLGRARHEKGERLGVGADAVEPVGRRGVGSLHPRRLRLSLHPLHERAGLRGQQHLALALAQTEAGLDGPAQELERRLGRVRILEEAEGVVLVVGAPQGLLRRALLARHLRRRVRPQRIVVHVDQRPARRVRDAESGVGNADVLGRRRDARGDWRRVVEHRPAVVNDAVEDVRRVGALGGHGGDHLGHDRRELPHRSLVEFFQNVRDGVQVTGHHQRSRRLVQGDAERLEHRRQQVPVVEANHGGHALLERVDGRGRHTTHRAELRYELAETLSVLELIRQIIRDGDFTGPLTRRGRQLAVLHHAEHPEPSEDVGVDLHLSPTLLAPPKETKWGFSGMRSSQSVKRGYAAIRGRSEIRSVPSV
mmetsp:Transcript_10269/g.40124  ORF Transcript_10269/g.40124 Transcript_10269/m.40124 type:complete len:522 (-) Transcript_10269:63-1628(-)